MKQYYSQADTEIYFEGIGENKVKVRSGGSVYPAKKYIDMRDSTTLDKAKSHAEDYADDKQDALLANKWDDLQVQMAALRLPSASYPSWLGYKGCEVLNFSASQTNTVYFSVQLPHTYKEGTDVKVHIHIAQTSNLSGTVALKLTYSWANVGEDFPSSTNEQLTYNIPINKADEHITIPLATLTGTGKKISSMILCSFSREGALAEDTFASTINLLGIDFHYEKDSLGSLNEWTK